MDRRIGKTRRALQQAMVDMMVEKDFDAITVQDIIDKADVGRSTFYAHFTDKYQLFGSGFADLTTEISQLITAAPAGRAFRFSLPFLQHCHGHRDLYRGLIGRPQTGAMVRDALTRGLRELVRSDLGPSALEARVAFVVGAYVGVVTWWLDTESPLTPEEVDTMFRKMAAGHRADAPR